MASTNVAKFAAELKMPAEALLEQLKAAGVDKRAPDDVLTEADKEQLLSALRRAHGGDDAQKRKITLTRKQTSEIKQADATGKARTIQVEVRKKRVFVKRDAGDQVSGEAAAQLVEEPERTVSVIDEEERSLREAEEARQRELLERQAAELRDKQERLELERKRAEEAEAEARRREEEARREADRTEAAQVAAAAAEQARASERAAAEAAGAGEAD
ncbi:MAG TPA: translation initiation factor IF-2 associated domain-containing protein, partial [Burkholderiaceae bacterium]|nr:translation initiation factor IF-2 associated domain-containing protein [Burkholderiaceae bacterium]